MGGLRCHVVPRRDFATGKFEVSQFRKTGVGKKGNIQRYFVLITQHQQHQAVGTEPPAWGDQWGNYGDQEAVPVALKVNTPYGIVRSVVLESHPLGFADRIGHATECFVQHQIEWSANPGTKTPPLLVFQVVAPKSPKLQGAQSHLEPVVANEEEVIRSFLQPAERFLERDIPTENVPEYLGWECVHIQ